MNETFSDFLSLVIKRQSVRSYSTWSIEPEKIERCIEAARLAPSACNSQPWKFIVVNDPDLRYQIADATSNRILPLNHFTKEAPVLIVVVRENANFTSKMGEIIRDKKFTLMDIGIATVHFCLQATSEGLGTCILGWFDESRVKKLLKIPGAKRAELIITVGYPKDDTIRDKKRKNFNEIHSLNSY
ncbi:MAG: nitroreductase family protein [Bacteroidales bacterium]|nr:nitroreductase family protein [Bacteroidales bacterium]